MRKTMKFFETNLFVGKLYTKHEKHLNHFCCIHCFGALLDINNAKLFFHNNGELEREKYLGLLLDMGIRLLIISYVIF